MSTAPGLLEPPREFEEYRLLRPLGHGAMGQVFLAEDTLLERLVAVKFIATPAGRLPDAAARARFFQEARAIARLQHPNVVAIHRVGEVRGQPYLVSELVRGEPLDRLPRPVEGGQALRLGIGLARRLAAAHRCGVLHRDIKPANAILSEDGEVKLLDFGLAEQHGALDTQAPGTVTPHAGDAPRPASEPGDTRPLPGPVTPHAGDAPRPAAEPADTRPLPGAVTPIDTRPLPGATAPRPLPLVGSEPEATRALPGATAQRPLPPIGSEPGTPWRVAHGTAASGEGPPRGILTDTRPAPGAAQRAPASVEHAARTSRHGALEPGAPPSAPGDAPERWGAATRTWNQEAWVAVPGTPLYLAPELWRGEPASRASDVYALGVLLYELCAGTAPYQGTPLENLGRAVLAGPPPPLAGLAPGLPSSFAAVVDRCLSADPSQRFESGDALREALEALAVTERKGALPSGNPYLGLRAFDAGHRGVFFGREAELREVMDRLRGEAFVLLAGDSGVGKSSLCRAGVLPLAASEGRAIVSCTPGRRPLEALVEALAPVLGESPDALLSRVATEEPGALARALRRGPSVLLFLDQLEELVTFSEPAQAARLAEELALVLRRAPRVRVLATARSDCLTRLVALPGLGEELPRALYLVRALTPHGLREAVEGPARALGVRFESPALVDALVTSAAGLPLLQFTLEALWEARDRERGLIPAAALESLGGVEGALARHADAVVARLRPEQRPRARELLLELVTPEGTRLRRTREELLRGPDDDTGRAVLDGLVRGRLLTAGEAEGGEGVYTLAHESLLTGWDTLRGWLGQDEQRRAVRHRLERAAAEWERLGRPAELLHGEKQLAEVQAAGVLTGSPRERSFIERSRQVARRRRAARWAVAVTVPLVLLAAVGVTRVQSRAQLQARVTGHLDSARTYADAARARSAQAAKLRAEAFALFDSPGLERREAAEAAWARVREEEQGAEASALKAMAALETAWSLDPGSARVREPMADLLAERVEQATLQRKPEQRAQLLARLAAYDDSGERRRRLEAPARVSVASTPPGARVWLEGTGDAGRELGRTPLSDVELPPGSHLLVLELPGRFPVRAPVMLDSGERLALELALPDAAAVPEGFVYVPPGRFLQGSSESEYLRRSFFFAPPLHAVETDAYLIARHEVTFGEYIAFLETLPPAEREARMPGNRLRHTVLSLSREAGGRWRLDLRPSSASYSARDGEPVRYGKRGRRAVQDWLRFPVSAISFDDALAYASWLDRTGRVPGARVCTEREWERAARGADGRRYPGGEWLAPDDANHDVTYGREPWGFGPDEVGSHPRSRSPFGVDDLAGNVWEWTRSSVDPDKASAQGGSWYQSELTSHSANRDVVERTQREALLGMRVCATPHP